MKGMLKRVLNRVRITPATVIATVALIVALGGVAYSAVPGPDGQIHACYLIDPDPDFSYMYIREHDASCQAGEKDIAWSQGADSALLAQATNSAGGINANVLKQISTQFTAIAKKLQTALPGKLQINEKKVLNAFKGKQDKALEKWISDLKKNDRKQAQYNAQLQQMAVLMKTMNAQIAASQGSVNDTINKVIGAIR